ncbi:MAG: hypothetical protein GY909_08255 [Oligoflexia bacterium]|nr:hypothetical protein [Oligoflexia bacterium]
MSNQKKLISSCTLTFKAFDHDVVMSPGKTTIWDFVTTDKRTGKKYCVYCALKMDRAKNLIKIALKKLPKDHRFVVITPQFSEQDEQAAEAGGYCITSVSVLNKFGQEMLEIKNAESANDSRSNSEEAEDHRTEMDPNEVLDVIDQALAKDKLF